MTRTKMSVLAVGSAAAGAAAMLWWVAWALRNPDAGKSCV